MWFFTVMLVMDLYGTNVDFQVRVRVETDTAIECNIVREKALKYFSDLEISVCQRETVR